jgi:hypothetical protein
MLTAASATNSPCDHVLTYIDAPQRRTGLHRRGIVCQFAQELAQRLFDRRGAPG